MGTQLRLDLRHLTSPQKKGALHLALVRGMVLALLLELGLISNIHFPSVWFFTFLPKDERLGTDASQAHVSLGG